MYNMELKVAGHSEKKRLKKLKECPKEIGMGSGAGREVGGRDVSLECVDEKIMDRNGVNAINTSERGVETSPKNQGRTLWQQPKKRSRSHEFEVMARRVMARRVCGGRKYITARVVDGAQRLSTRGDRRGE